jgi:excisionase family DNA binding protein
MNCRHCGAALEFALCDTCEGEGGWPGEGGEWIACLACEGEEGRWVCPHLGTARHSLVGQRQDDRLLTFKEAMASLRVSRSTLYRLMRRGDLVGAKVGSTWRFWEQDLATLATYGRELGREGAGDA